VASVSLTIAGGDNLAAKLAQIAGKLGAGGSVNVGFLAGAPYPAKPGEPSLNVATVAFWNEFGTSNAPPRPFFRRMIAAKSPNWGKLVGAAVKKADYDVPQTLGIVGEVIKGELRQSIVDLVSPPLAPYTIKKKGHDKPLIETSLMLNSVDSEVTTGTPST
jgi:hypothetical protein